MLENKAAWVNGRDYCQFVNEGRMKTTVDETNEHHHEESIEDWA